MSNPKIGLLGAGNMARALARGLIQGFVTPASNIFAYDVAPECCAMVKEMGVQVLPDCSAVVKAADIVVLAVKPDQMAELLKEVKHDIDETLVVSVAAGVTTAQIEDRLKHNARVVRVMPNTAVLVREGASAVAGGSRATKDDIERVQAMMAAVGSCVVVKESQMNAITGLSGSGPAYGYLAIEALADGGVHAGLPRAVAQKLAAQTLLGAARMVLESGKPPGQLKDEVCSPAGTTIAGVRALEEGGLRAAFMNAVIASKTRADELGAN